MANALHSKQCSHRGQAGSLRYATPFGAEVVMMDLTAFRGFACVTRALQDRAPGVAPRGIPSTARQSSDVGRVPNAPGSFNGLLVLVTILEKAGK